MTSALAPLIGWLGELGLFYYRRARVVRCDVADAVSEVAGNGIEVVQASEEDLRSMAQAQSRDPTEWLAKAAGGSICLLARSGPARLGYLWITRSPERMTEVDHVLDVSQDAAGVYLYDGYVFSGYRRRGVLGLLLAFSKRWALQAGVSRLYAAYARENRVSEHALERAGFTAQVGDITVVRVLGLEWKRVRVPRPRPVIDVLGSNGRSGASTRPV